MILALWMLRVGVVIIGKKKNFCLTQIMLLLSCL
jgi:hypothetical protein